MVSGVNIQADSTSATITVSKPDEYTFYYYNGNHDGKNNEGTTIYADFPYGTVTGGGDSGKSGYSTNSLSLVDGELHFAS